MTPTRTETARADLAVDASDPRPPAARVSPSTTVADQRDALANLGALPRHQAWVLRSWLQNRPLDKRRVAAEHALPRRLREAWPALKAGWDSLAALQVRETAEDGERLLLRLHDGETVEAVLLPRGGLCVSTQAGCAVGCTFCMTGRGGLRRQLGGAEIVAQVAAARRLRPVSKVVFMGMGEPAHNLDAVLEAIELLADEGAIAHKKLVLSTVGDERVFERLSTMTIKPALAVSLHTVDDALRERLLPKAPRIPVARLVALTDAYARASGYPAQWQWTLLDGVNDGLEQADAIVALLKGRHAMLNLIPMNEVAGTGLRRPPAARAAELTRLLNARGVLTRLRQSAAQTVEGGCGQLRARQVPEAAAFSPAPGGQAAMPMIWRP
jgi:23S rRNA (adenine2503-C2)-methyltransferase